VGNKVHSAVHKEWVMSEAWHSCWLQPQSHAMHSTAGPLRLMRHEHMSEHAAGLLGRSSCCQAEVC
jgi:hypothetical protein